MSNREIARRLGVDHKTVGSIRDEAEATGEIPQLDTRVGADGKERPATKPSGQEDDGDEAGARGRGPRHT